MVRQNMNDKENTTMENNFCTADWIQSADFFHQSPRDREVADAIYDLDARLTELELALRIKPRDDASEPEIENRD